MTDFRSAQQPDLLKALSDEALQQLTVEVLLAVEADHGSHRLNCRCSGLRDINGPRVTCSDLARVIDEQLRRRKPSPPRYKPDWQGARVSDGEWSGRVT